MGVADLRDRNGKITGRIARDLVLQVDGNVLDHRNAPIADAGAPVPGRTVEYRATLGIDAGQRTLAFIDQCEVDQSPIVHSFIRNQTTRTWLSRHRSERLPVSRARAGSRSLDSWHSL